MEELTPIREERLKQVYLCVNGAGDAGASIREVANCMGFERVTPYLTEMLDQCEKRGWLRKEPSILNTGRGARMGWRYFVTPEEQSQ